MWSMSRFVFATRDSLGDLEAFNWRRDMNLGGLGLVSTGSGSGFFKAMEAQLGGLMCLIEDSGLAV